MAEGRRRCGRLVRRAGRADGAAGALVGAAKAFAALDVRLPNSPAIRLAPAAKQD